MSKKKFIVVAGLILLAFIIVACQPQTETVEVTRVVTETVVEEGEEVEVTRIVTEQVEVEVEVTRVVEVAAEAEPEDVTLVVWFLSQSPEEIELNRSLIEGWAADYTDANVTIDFSPFAFEDWNNAMKLALDGHSGPDLAYGSPGGPRIGTWGEAGHLVDLTDIAEERGWYDIVPESVIWHYNPGGPGHLWSMSYDAVTIGVYYNKDMFAENGWEIPETQEEFEELLATIKDAGITPIAVGAQTPWNIEHVFSTLSHTNTPWEKYEGWMNCVEGGGVPEEWIPAAEKLNEWINAGYFNENPLAVEYADASTLFITGQTAMDVGGTWNNSTFASQPEFEVGFFAMPRMNPDLPEYHMAGFTPNNGWTVPVYSEHQEIAIDLMDFMVASEESAIARWNDGNIVAYNFETLPPPVYPLQADVYDTMQVAMTGTYDGQLGGEIGPVLNSNIQAMIGGEITPEEAMAAADEAYQTFCAEAAANE